MRTKLIITLFTLIVSLPTNVIGKDHSKKFHPGALWPDNKGIHINAHGGGILYYKRTYYWFGEYKSDTTSAAMVGVTCYSSKNLLDWTNRGVALSVSDDENSDIAKGCVLERPKVVYNQKTKKFVMWFHLELKGNGYSAARYGVATSNVVTGPYHFLCSGRVNPNVYPINFSKDDSISIRNQYSNLISLKWWTPEWYDAIKKGLFMFRDLPGGQMARDQTIFVDDDNKAYHIYSSEDNLTLQVAELSDDYTSHTGKYARIAPSNMNEAPAIFKKDGIYWMITSGCTGWDPNEARMFMARHIMGPWTQLPNPCIGAESKITFGGQSTYILRVEGKKNAYIFMADIWRPKHPSDARYIWLPIDFKAGRPVIQWRSEWQLDYLNK
ncbi:glycoside hydrolase family 43 protein [Xylanibacter oryzae]|uniref:glycoside hydrolase family 43 protein n=1 Tax=Xylanibacter oryzae TaxID=185293 RepID=UPI0004B183C1|nr:glycoside hydrolase family 43 protein [Xylanibacter oryzae]